MNLLEELFAKLRALKITLAVNGDQLVCRAPKGILTAQINQEIKDNKQAIIDYLKNISNDHEYQDTISPIEPQTDYPLSFSQLRLWFLYQLEGPSATYNMPLVLTLSGPLKQEILKKSLNDIYHRHEVFRYNFKNHIGGPRIHINQKLFFDLQLIECNQENYDASIDQIIKNPFNLEKDVLLRAFLIKESLEHHYLIINTHHIVSDGWSLSNLLRELATLYKTYSDHQLSPLPPLKLQYKDYCAWQSQQLQGSRLEKLMNFWKNTLEGAPDLISLPIDRQRPKFISYKGYTYHTTLSDKLSDQVKKLSNKGPFTLFMIFLAAYAVTLAKYANQDDVVIGSPIANRQSQDVEPIIGLFINMLALRIRLQNNLTSTSLLHQVRAICLDAYQHQDIPFEQLVEEINPKRNLDHAPIFQVAFDLQNAENLGVHLSELQIKTLEQANVPAKFDLNLSVIEKEEQFTFAWNFNTDLFDLSSIEQIDQTFQLILDQMVSKPQKIIDTYPLISEREKNSLIDHQLAFNQTMPEAYLYDLIVEQAKHKPDHIVINFENKNVSYSQLMESVERCASLLIQKGVTTEKYVVVYVDRSLEMLISILGILRAGGAYIPIDAAFPIERLQIVLEDSEPHLIITQDNLVQHIPKLSNKVQLIEELFTQNNSSESLLHPPRPIIFPSQIAYAIFTSGSTGRPKGVQITHQALANFLCSMEKSPGFNHQDQLLAITTISFDIAGLELFLPLVVGGSLSIATREQAIDGRALQKEILNRNINIIQATPSTWKILLETQWQPPVHFRALCGGEALTTDLSEKLLHLHIELWNMYGPTETTIWSAVRHIKNSLLHQQSVEVVGWPIQNTQIYVVNNHQEIQPIGMPGELLIGGLGLARGYLNRPDLTADNYRPNPFGNMVGDRIYYSGDLAKRTTDGEFDFLGRKDQQIKIRGFRIEIGEIESAIRSYPLIEDAIVITSLENTQSQNLQLIAYYVVKKSSSAVSSLEAKMRSFLKQTLPAYMIPSQFVVLEKIPLTPNYKVDRKALPAPLSVQESDNKKDIYPKSPLETEIKTIWEKFLQKEHIGLDDNFFDLGGHSLLLTQVNERLRTVFKQDIPLITLFEKPTIRLLANWLNQLELIGDNQKNHSFISNSEPIAIIGMSLQFPGAQTPPEFWENLKNGKESIRFFSEEELVEAGVEPELIASPNYIRGTGTLENVENFDAEFFSYTPSDAKWIDPQQRIFLETAYHALESSGYAGDVGGQRIGVFAGVGHNDYLIRNIVPHIQETNYSSVFDLIIANDKDFLSTRVSYAFNLKGPSINIQTACSTSLVAIHMACSSIYNGESDMAIAGGVAIKIPHYGGYLHEEGMISSKDGHCRAFDKDASGTVWGSGSAALILKPLSKATEDRDTILAVIKGSAINNDGSIKVGFTAPSVSGQKAVIEQAIARSGIAKESIQYIETHGTGTELGDLIEITALKEVFDSNIIKDKIQLGSVKTNIGHLNNAAGIAGVCKVILSLQNKQIPPTLHFQELNPKLGLENAQFEIQAKLSDWPPSQTPLRAGVSSFGIGGTNAHLILEEAPIHLRGESKRKFHVVSLSARSSKSLQLVQKNLLDYLVKNPQTNLANLVFTLHMGRKNFSYRSNLIVSNINQLIENLKALCDSKRILDSSQSPRRVIENPRVAFLFPGQGSQFIGMGSDLYLNEPIFKDTVDQCAIYLLPVLGFDLRKLINPETTISDEEISLIDQTWVTQPLLFVTEYALSKVWMKWGIHPTAMLGHSLGEYVAACLAGVFSLEAALTIVARRGKLMFEQDRGGMVAIPLSVAQFNLSNYPELDLAAINLEDSIVVSGPHQSIEALLKDLSEQDITCIQLKTSHAFHSRMMDGAVGKFISVVKDFQLNPPTIPFISNLTGQWITAEEATNPNYWGDHLRSTVLFNQGLELLIANSEIVLLEVGPNHVLSSLAKRHQLASQSISITSCIYPAHLKTDENIYFSLGQLWEKGVKVNWQSFYEEEKLSRIPLPTYPFERKRHWIDAPKPGSVLKLSNEGNRNPFEEWFYLPNWRPTLNPISIALKNDFESPKKWVVLANHSEFCQASIAYLKKMGQIVYEIYSKNDISDTVNQYVQPMDENDYGLAFKNLNIQSIFKVLHFWSFDTNFKESTALEDFQKHQMNGYYSLIYLTKVLANLIQEEPINITLIANYLHDIDLNGAINPSKTTVIGPALVIPQEMPQFTIHCLDFGEFTSDAPEYLDRKIQQLFSEIENGSTEPMVAYRNSHRLVPSYQRIQLPVQQVTSLLRKNGTYLITGGLGRVGLTFAEFFNQRVEANLCLFSRTPFPEKSQWLDIMQRNENILLCKTLRRLIQLEQKGSQVIVLSGDVSNPADILRITKTVEQVFGKLHGVVHAAGLPSQLSPFIKLTETESAEQFQAKVTGTNSLNSIFKDYDLDFFLGVSSTSSILGGLGYSAYSAANIYLDNFISYQNRLTNKFPWLSINWDAWEFSKTDDQLKQPSDLTMSPSESNQALDRIMSSLHQGRIIVAVGDIEARFKNWVIREDWQQDQVKNLSTANHQRPELSSDYFAPLTLTEKKLSEIWGGFLGYQTVGVMDNFFELGGDSMLAIRLMSSIKQQFHKVLPLTILLNKPTIKELAIEIDASEKSMKQSALVIMQDKGTNSPLFCVPGTGGSVMYLLHMAEQFKNYERPIYGLQAMNSEETNKPLDDIELIASMNIEAILKVQQVGTFHLCGHSFGSWVVLAMAQQLENLGHQVHVSILDTALPTERDVNRIKNWKDSRWLTTIGEVIGQTYKTRIELDENKLDALNWDDQILILHKSLASLKLIEVNSDPVETKKLVEVYKTQAQILYSPKPIQVSKIHLIRANDLLPEFLEGIPDSIVDDPFWGWQSFSRTTVSIDFVSGNHHTMLMQPNVQELSKKIELGLKKDESHNLADMKIR